MLALLSPFSNVSCSFVSNYGSIKSHAEPSVIRSEWIEIATVPSQQEMHCFYDSTQGIEVTMPVHQVDSPLLPVVRNLQSNMALETISLSPSRVSSTPFRGYSLFRVSVLAGMVGIIEIVSIYSILKGISVHQPSFTLLGFYGAYSALREARTFERTYVSTATPYEKETLIKQVMILCCSLLTLQQCNIRHYPQIEAEELL